jgi:hypothetical protein
LRAPILCILFAARRGTNKSPSATRGLSHLLLLVFVESFLIAVEMGSGVKGLLACAIESGFVCLPEWI